MPALRSHLYFPVVNNHGDVLSNVTVRFYEPGTTQQIDVPVYAQPSGNNELSQPISFSDGVVDAYMTVPKTVRVGIEPAGQAEFYLEDVDFGPAGSNAVYTDGAPLLIKGRPSAVGQVLVSNSDGSVSFGAAPSGGGAGGVANDVSFAAALALHANDDSGDTPSSGLNSVHADWSVTVAYAGTNYSGYSVAMGWKPVVGSADAYAAYGGSGPDDLRSYDVVAIGDNPRVGVGIYDTGGTVYNDGVYDQIAIGDYVGTYGGRDQIAIGDGAETWADYDAIAIGDGAQSGSSDGRYSHPLPPNNGNYFNHGNAEDPGHGLQVYNRVAQDDDYEGDLIAIGDGAYARGRDAIAIGDGAYAGSSYPYASDLSNWTDNRGVQGPFRLKSSSDNLAIGDGPDAGVRGYFNVHAEFGLDNDYGSSYNVAIGGGSGAGGTNLGDYNTAVGEYARASGYGPSDNIGLHHGGAQYAAGRSTAIGYDATADGYGNNTAVGADSLARGRNNTSLGTESLTVDRSAELTALGAYATAGEQYAYSDRPNYGKVVVHATAVGTGSIARRAYEVELGTPMDVVNIPNAFVMTSPNGTRFVTTVTDSGGLQVQPATPHPFIESWDRPDTVKLGAYYNDKPATLTPGYDVFDSGVSDGLPKVADNGQHWFDPTFTVDGSTRYPWVVRNGMGQYLGYDDTERRPMIHHSGPDMFIGVDWMVPYTYTYDFGLFFGMSDDGLNGYLFAPNHVLNYYTFPNNGLFRVDNGALTCIAQTGAGLPDSETSPVYSPAVGNYRTARIQTQRGIRNRLQVRRSGNHITCYINGRRTIEFDDSTYHGSVVGLYFSQQAGVPNNNGINQRHQGDVWVDNLIDYSVGNIMPDAFYPQPAAYPYTVPYAFDAFTGTTGFRPNVDMSTGYPPDYFGDYDYGYGGANGSGGPFNPTFAIPQTT